MTTGGECIPSAAGNVGGVAVGGYDLSGNTDAIWALGCNTNSGGDYGIYNLEGGSWYGAGGYAQSLAINVNTDVWAIVHDGSLWEYSHWVSVWYEEAAAGTAQARTQFAVQAGNQPWYLNGSTGCELGWSDASSGMVCISHGSSGTQAGTTPALAIAAGGSGDLYIQQSTFSTSATPWMLGSNDGTGWVIYLPSGTGPRGCAHGTALTGCAFCPIGRYLDNGPAIFLIDGLGALWMESGAAEGGSPWTKVDATPMANLACDANNRTVYATGQSDSKLYKYVPY